MGACSLRTRSQASPQSYHAPDTCARWRKCPRLCCLHASAKLPPGRYRYRLVVDGQWQQDPYNETSELNPFGGYNSIVEVK